MYQTALIQREFYIEQFGWHRFKMVSYYMVLACVLWFWMQPPEPVVCSECGSVAEIVKEVYWNIECIGCGYKLYSISGKSKRSIIEQWNTINHGMVCDIRKD